ncbi:MAG: hypothetical protein Q9180_009136, partial [Flavoplaca navasiana]
MRLRITAPRWGQSNAFALNGGCAEQNIGKRLRDATDRKTRYEGKVRPFLGERIDGEPLAEKSPSPGKKRKFAEAYPSSTPPAKKVR